MSHLNINHFVKIELIRVDRNRCGATLIRITIKLNSRRSGKQHRNANQYNNWVEKKKYWRYVIGCIFMRDALLLATETSIEEARI